jgi:hypothetical protein
MPTDYTTYFTSEQTATEATQDYSTYTNLASPAQTRSFDWLYFISTQPYTLVPATMTSYKSREEVRAARRLFVATTPDTRYYILRLPTSALDDLISVVS